MDTFNIHGYTFSILIIQSEMISVEVELPEIITANIVREITGDISSHYIGLISSRCGTIPNE